MAPNNKTEKLCYDYASAAPFHSEITGLKPAGNGQTAVLLERTIFFPEGGGQPADRGTINGLQLLDVQENEEGIFHIVKDTEALKPGPAELVLDCRRRRDLAQLHTGQHLLSATILRLYGAPTVSMHMGDEACTIDVDAAELSEEELLVIEDAVADAIEENHPVIVHLCPPEDISSFPLRRLPPKGEEVIRVVEIAGHDCIACCGTHLKSTAEIGLLRIFGAEKYKGKTRVSFLAGHRLLIDNRLLRKNAVIVSRAISVPLGEIGKGVLEYQEKSLQMEKRLKVLEEKAVQEKAHALLCKATLLCRATLPEKATNAPGAANADYPVVVVESYAEEGIDEALSIGKIAQKKSQAAFVLASEQDRKFAAFCSDKSFDLRSFLKETFETFGGRGGGSSSLFQGSFATKEALDAFLRAIGHKANTQP